MFSNGFLHMAYTNSVTKCPNNQLSKHACIFVSVFALLVLFEHFLTDDYFTHL